MGIPENLKSLMVRFDINQDALARIVGVSQPAVSGWMRGEKKPGNASVRKICDKFGLEPNDILSEKYGLASPYRRGSRSHPADALTPIMTDGSFVPVRMLGSVHAGDADEGFEDAGEVMVLKTLVERHQNCYALEVRGTCMNKNFTEKDYVFVDPSLTPKDGSIAVVVLDGGDIVVRRVRKGNSTLLLQAETTEPEAWPDIVIQGETEARLIGTVFWWQSKGEMQ